MNKNDLKPAVVFAEFAKINEIPRPYTQASHQGHGELQDCYPAESHGYGVR